MLGSIVAVSQNTRGYREESGLSSEVSNIKRGRRAGGGAGRAYLRALFGEH